MFGLPNRTFGYRDGNLLKIKQKNCILKSVIENLDIIAMIFFCCEGVKFIFDVLFGDLGKFKKVENP